MLVTRTKYSATPPPTPRRPWRAGARGRARRGEGGGRHGVVVHLRPGLRAVWRRAVVAFGPAPFADVWSLRRGVRLRTREEEGVGGARAEA